MRFVPGGARGLRCRHSTRSCASGDWRHKRATRSTLRETASAHARCGAKPSSPVRRPRNIVSRAQRAAQPFRNSPRRRAARIRQSDHQSARCRRATADPRGGFGRAPVRSGRHRRHRHTRSSVVATSRDGSQVRSRYLVLASGYEFPGSCRRRAITSRPPGHLPPRPQRRRLWPEECLIWEASTPYLYARTTPDGRELCGGEDPAGSVADHGEAALARKIARLQRKLGKLFPALDTDAAFSWAASFGETATGLPRSARYRATGIAGSRSAMAAMASPTAGSPRRSSAPR